LDGRSTSAVGAASGVGKRELVSEVNRSRGNNSSLSAEEITLMKIGQRKKKKTEKKKKKKKKKRKKT
jgi:hypothetical protein